MSERENTNHNQMGQSSNSGKILVKEKEKFQRGKRKKGGLWRGGDFFVFSPELFLGERAFM